MTNPEIKTILQIEITSPKEFHLQQSDDENYNYTDGKEFAKDFHKVLVQCINGLNIDYFADHDGIIEFCDEDGNYPEHSITVSDEDYKKVLRSLLVDLEKFTVTGYSRWQHQQRAIKMCKEIREALNK